MILKEKFYFFLKILLKTNLSDNQAIALLKIYSFKSSFVVTISQIIEHIESKIKRDSKKQKLLLEILDEVDGKLSLKLFIFSLKLFMIKDLLLQEAKMKKLLDISKLESLDPLSLEYNNITLYNRRVNCVLLSSIFFDKLDKNETNFISQDAEDYIRNLLKLAIELRKEGLEFN